MKKETWYHLYRLFKAIGMPKITVPVEIKKGSHTYTLPMGWPSLQIAISLDSNTGKKFKQEGWQVIYIPANALNAAEPLVAMLDELSRKRTIADSFAEAEMTVSKTENKLLNHILTRGLPEPDRNYKFYDGHGSLITVPDFVWEKTKVAVFVDGEFFHGLKDISDALQVALENDPDIKNDIVAQSKDTMARDAAKRRKLTKAGWKVVVVTASEIDTGDLDPIVDDIQAAMSQPLSVVDPTESGQRKEGGRTIGEPEGENLGDSDEVGEELDETPPPAGEPFSPVKNIEWVEEGEDESEYGDSEEGIVGWEIEGSSQEDEEDEEDDGSIFGEYEDFLTKNENFEDLPPPTSKPVHKPPPQITENS